MNKYRDIKLESSTDKIYVVKLKNKVGSKELTKAIRLSNPNLSVYNLGLFSEYLDIEKGSTIVLVSSTTDTADKAGEISKVFEGSPVIILEEYSAYSEEYEKKHKTKKERISAGFNYNNHNFQIDETSRGSITGKAISLLLDPSITFVNWVTNTKDKEGNDIVYRFTRDEFLDFAKQVTDYYENIILNT